MFDVLRFKADAPIARISAALARTPARRVALVFPLGMPVTIADVAVLATLAARAQSARKSVTIVGGDAHLRACAVTAGFAASTSLDEWRTAKDDRPGGPSNTPALALLDAASGGLALSATSTDESAAWEIDPPPYIARLLHAEGHGDPHGCAGLVGVDSSGNLRVLPPPSDAAAYLAALRASERHEEDISDIIRETSGFDLSGWVPPASRAAGESDFGESRPS